MEGCRWHEEFGEESTTPHVKERKTGNICGLRELDARPQEPGEGTGNEAEGGQETWLKEVCCRSTL